MAGWRQAVALAISEEQIEQLTSVSRSRTERAEAARRTGTNASCLPRDPIVFCGCATARAHRQTVQRCIERAVALGPLAALDDRPRPGKEPTITPQAKAWLVSLACDKAKDHGYPHELWDDTAAGTPCARERPGGGA